MSGEGRGRGRPAIGAVVELRLPADVLAAVESEAADLGWKRAELLRWIVVQRYGPEGWVVVPGDNPEHASDDRTGSRTAGN